MILINVRPIFLYYTCDGANASAEARRQGTGVRVRLTDDAAVELGTQARVAVAVALAGGAVEARVVVAGIEEVAVGARVAGRAAAGVGGAGAGRCARAAVLALRLGAAGVRVGLAVDSWVEANCFNAVQKFFFLFLAQLV